MADPGASKLSDFNNVLPHDRTCCGVVEHAAITVREKRSSRTTKQPWIVLKLMVFVTIGILGYTSYVYIGRLCLPMIRKHSGAPAGRGTGSKCQTSVSWNGTRCIMAWLRNCRPYETFSHLRSLQDSGN
jgi:hypothetical protein